MLSLILLCQISSQDYDHKFIYDDAEEEKINLDEYNTTILSSNNENESNIKKDLKEIKYAKIGSENQNVSSNIANFDNGYGKDALLMKKEKLKNELDEFFEEKDDYEVEIEK